jgi:hypothetical protein
MQEQVNERTVALSVKGAKLTAHLLAKAMRAFVNKAREPPAKGAKATGLSRTALPICRVSVSMVRM